MGAEFQVDSLEDMCSLMCDNYIPIKEKHDQMTNKEAIEELKKVDTLDMPARLCEAHYMAIKALEQEPCDDAISREAVKELIKSGVSTDTYDDVEQVCKWIDALPSVTPQEPKTGHCKDCKYFEYDSVAKVDGVPLIVAHEMCSRWGDGCKTREDGYCFLFEPQESEEV